MKYFWWIIAFMLPCAIYSSSLKDPRRMVNAQTVDLAPLFRWWTNHDGERPLSAWVRVTGTVVGTNTWGWLLLAHVQEPPNREQGPAKRDEQTRILLRNPPMEDCAEFQRLISELKSL